jgi:hypothetical protein
MVMSSHEELRDDENGSIPDGVFETKNPTGQLRDFVDAVKKLYVKEGWDFSSVSGRHNSMSIRFIEPNLFATKTKLLYPDCHFVNPEKVKLDRSNNSWWQELPIDEINDWLKGTNNYAYKSYGIIPWILKYERSQFFDARTRVDYYKPGEGRIGINMRSLDDQSALLSGQIDEIKQSVQPQIDLLEEARTRLELSKVATPYSFSDFAR